MSLHQILLILRARYGLVLFVIVTTIAAALAVAWVLPPRYKATTTLVVDFKVIDTITGAFLPVQLLLSSYMATELDILASQTVALKVVKALRLSDDEKTKARFQEATGGKGTIEDWIASGLLGKLDVKPAKESRMIEVNFTSVDPQFAADVANAFAQAYIQTNLEMKVAPARESATWFDGQLKQLRDQLEDAQGRLSKYQSEKGITTTDQKLDVETAKLAEISSQFVQVQAQVYEYASRQKQLREYSAQNVSVDALPEVLASPVITELKARLSAAESRLSQASNTMGVNHPEYQRAQSEVTSLRKKLRDEVGTVASVINNNLKISQAREQELKDAVSGQKARLLELNRHRDELGVLMKEVDNAQRSFDSASQRHTQTSLESRMDQANVTVLASARAPLDPAFPKMPLIGALAAVVGILLGIGASLAAELLDRRVRGVEDLANAAGAQVWGTLEDTSSLAKGVERKNRKNAGQRRFLRPLREPAPG